MSYQPTGRSLEHVGWSEECPPLCFLDRGVASGKAVFLTCTEVLSFMKSVSVFVCAPTILPVSLLSVVFVPVAPSLVSILLLIFVAAAAPMMFMVCVASIIPVISGRRSAAHTASVRGLAPQASSFGRAGLTGVPLQAGGAQGVEEEALVGTPQWTFQPSCRAHGLRSHPSPVSLLEELLHCTLLQFTVLCHRVVINNNL